jgi:hypothetical protein
MLPEIRRKARAKLLAAVHVSEVVTASGSKAPDFPDVTQRPFSLHSATPNSNGPLYIRVVSQLRSFYEVREEWFSLAENHEKLIRFPDFLQRGTSREK